MAKMTKNFLFFTALPFWGGGWGMENIKPKKSLPK